MNKKFVFVYEPQGLGNARRKISLRQTEEVRIDDFEFMSLQQYLESDYLNPDFLILEDEAQYQIELVKAAMYIDEISLIVICDSFFAIEGAIDTITQSPKVVTLDYKIGGNRSPERVTEIYKKFRERFKTPAVIGYTNFGRQKTDMEFSARSADELTNLLRSNGDSVIEKSGMTDVALGIIIYDKIEIQSSRKMMEKLGIKNNSLEKQIEQQAHALDAKVNAYTPSITMQNLEHKIIGSSWLIKQIKYYIERNAAKDIPVLITGENGTGKELIAKAIHRISKRGWADKFIAVDCGSVPEGLFESEFFGYEVGAHSTATKQKIGYIEAADGGTLFLDEIGNLSYTSQVKLLRVLQEKKIRRLGGTKEIAVNFRLISATNKDLPEMVSQGSFHRDLYGRIFSWFPAAPPLHERPEDIPLLINHFCHMYKTTFKLTVDAIEYMSKFYWEGNVRQLQRFIENLDTHFDDEMVSSKEVAALLKTNSIHNNSPATGQSAEHCREAEELLDRIDIFLLTNEKYKAIKKIKNLKEFSADFFGKSRNALFEKRDKLTPCFLQLMSKYPHRWKAITEKELKIVVKAKKNSNLTIHN